MAVVIVGLARMNFDWSKTFVTRGTNPFVCRLESLLSCSTSTGGGGDMHPIGTEPTAGGVSFVSINAQSKKAKYQSSDSISSAELGDVIWGLGTMNARRSELPPSLRIALLAAFDSKWLAFNGFSLSSALWAFAKMGINWSALASSTRQQLPKRLLELERR